MDDRTPDGIPFERDWLRKLIAAFAPQDDARDADLSVERAGELLWDLSTDEAVAAALLRDGLQSAVKQQLQCTHGCILELCFGILANLCSCPSFWLLIDDSILLRTLQLFLELEDPPALSEACRMLTAALSTDEGVSVWLPVLSKRQQQLLPHLLMIIQNTLHSQLLQRSLQLLATLLQAEADLSSHPTLQQHQQQQQDPQLQQLGSLLLQYGLIDALAAVLVPATSYGVAAAGAGAAAQAAGGAGGWSDDEQEPGPLQQNSAGTEEEEDDSSSRRAARLYSQPDVLLALMAVLEQLGQRQELADAAVQQLAQLPALLLLLLAACAAAGRQEVLERLLPLLVMLRGAILPLLLLPLQQLDSAPSVDDSGNSAVQGAPDLALLLAVAVVLQDCSPDSLDALDAGWFLVAVGSRELWQRTQQQQQQQQQQQGAQDGISGVKRWLEQLPQLCVHLSRARIPASAACYAQDTVLRLADSCLLQDQSASCAATEMQPPTSRSAAEAEQQSLLKQRVSAATGLTLQQALPPLRVLAGNVSAAADDATEQRAGAAAAAATQERLLEVLGVLQEMLGDQIA